MKNRKAGKLTVCLGCAVMMACMVTGCAAGSTGAEEPREEVIRIEDSTEESRLQKENEQEQQDDSAENEKTDSAKRNDEQAEEAQEAGDGAMPAQTEDETELNGDIISIGENSMVVSKIFTYAVDGNEEAEVAVSVMSEDAVLITVYFSENTEFIVRTVKNGGVNGEADAENSAGTSADLQERKTVLMTGGYEGEDFHAEQVVIYNFV